MSHIVGGDSLSRTRLADRSGYAVDGALRHIAEVMREVNVARGLRGQSVGRVRALERWMG